MVALSGWPEPVYIAGPPSGSRDNTPGPSGEYYEGISNSDISRHAVHAGPSTTISNDWSIKPEIHAGPSGKPAPYQRDPPNAPVPPSESIFSRTCMYNNDPTKPCPIPDHPNHIAKYQHPNPMHHQPLRDPFAIRADSPSAFPTSSARSTPHPSPPVSRRGSPKPTLPSLLHTSSPLAVDAHDVEDDLGPTARTFRDPRLAPHVAVMSNRPALPLAPTWSSSSVSNSSGTGENTPSKLPYHLQSTGVGVRIPAGQRGTGILVMRAVPDVYPPPASVPGIAGMATEMTRSASASQNGRRKSRALGSSGGALEVATEVYPRDPDSAILWGTGVPSRKSSFADLSRRTSMAVEEGKDVSMDLDSN